MKKRLLAVALIMTMVFSLNVIQGFGEEFDEGMMDISGITFSYTKANSSIKKVKMEVDGGFYAGVQSYDLTIPTSYSTMQDNLSVKLNLNGSSENMRVFAEYLNREGQMVKIPMTSKYRILKNLFKEEVNPDGFQLGIYDNDENLIKSYRINLLFKDDYYLEKTKGFFKFKSYLKKNPCYKEGTKIQVKGLMLHSVGEPRNRADYYIKKWNKPNYMRACVHGFINADDGSLYQTLPWSRKAWHAGASANNTHIGVEMCEPANIKYMTGRTFTSRDIISARRDARRTYYSAVELFAELCIKYNLDPLEYGVVISHSEGYKMRVASNHGDPEHLWKGLGLEFTMDGFRQDVKNKMTEIQTGVR